MATGGEECGLATGGFQPEDPKQGWELQNSLDSEARTPEEIVELHEDHDDPSPQRTRVLQVKTLRLEQPS